MKPRPDHISRVLDAIAVLKSRGLPHYRPDIAAFTGLTKSQVQRVLDHLEARAKSNPKGKTTVPWTLQAGDKGGIAVAKVDRMRAQQQRRKAILSQLVRDAARCEAEFRRTPLDSRWAKQWVISARGINVEAFDAARDEINTLHLTALLDRGDDPLPALKGHMDFMAEIDQLR